MRPAKKRAKLTPVKQPIERELTRQELADALDLNLRSIRRHHDRENPPPHTLSGSNYFYNEAEYVAWMRSEGLTGEAHKRASNDSPDIEAAKLRKENALADKHELANAQSRGELVRVDDVKAFIAERNTQAKNKLIGLGAAITPHLEGRDAGERQAIIDARVNEILAELSRPPK